MVTLFSPSLLVLIVAAAHLLLPILGPLNLLLLWAAAHAAQIKGLTLLIGLTVGLIKLYLVLPRLWRRWFG